MSSPIIKAHNLSKRYRIGAAEKGHKTLREAIMDGVSAPVRNLARLRSLTKFKDGYEEDVIWALKDISFEVNEGETLGIIGKNGGGKTTILKILSRITEPTSGLAEIRGRVSSLLEVGTGFHPELTGRENIFLNGAILGMRRREIERKFDDIVNFAEIERFLDTPVKRYSSGMYVRLAFAVAAHLDPEILLVDEVLAVGDIGFQKRCINKMTEVAEGGRTVLFVSHNMGAIRGLCKTAIWLDNGQIAKRGAVDGVVKDYEEHLLRHFRQSSDPGIVERDPEEVKGKRFYFTRVEMLNEAGEHTNIFRYGDKITLKAEFSGEPVSDSFIAEYYLYGELGQLVSIGSSGAFHGIYFSKNVRRIKIEVGPLLLVKGEYAISLSTCGEMGDLGQRTDTWESACSFSIIECHPFLPSRDITAQHGVCVLQQSFSALKEGE